MSLNTIELNGTLDLHVTDADLLGSIGFAVDSPSTLPAYFDNRRNGSQDSSRTDR
ncbi:hypothetical protein QMK17_10825 [Rhodococcus sp. G-MC3]|uniref:hypothetical protein n=1 Tax=Rhodococcus sp. G-MC3 TaxID=3046209 RepID=UPI0024BA0674|nr:hypothetical protein [Rhodococcus sp. G-MC3]MDJ0393824.1 hypothetical protein [Rhodococcus sp. G-MC3]